MKLSINTQCAIAAAFIGLIPAFVWWLILTGIQWVLNKSGANGAWIGDIKIYVALSFYVLGFVMTFINLRLAMYSKVRRRR